MCEGDDPKGAVRDERRPGPSSDWILKTCESEWEEMTEKCVKEGAPWFHDGQFKLASCFKNARVTKRYTICRYRLCDWICDNLGFIMNKLQDNMADEELDDLGHYYYDKICEVDASRNYRNYRYCDFLVQECETKVDLNKMMWITTCNWA